MNEGKMKKCAHCGAEIAMGAKTCPACGGKNKKPIYKRPWFIVLIVVLVIGAVSSLGGEDTPTSTGNDQNSSNAAAEKEEKIEYTAYNVDELMADLDENALKAADKYKGQYVELTGKLSNIDSSGDYISVFPLHDEFAFIGVHCSIKNDEQLDAVKEMSTGDTIVVKGKITDVGEALGFWLDIDSFEK